MKKHEIPTIMTIVLSVALVVCSIGAVCFAKMCVYRPNYLVVVDEEHPFSPNYLDEIELVETQDIYGVPCQIEKNTYQTFKALQNDLQQQDITIGIRAAYRNQEMQRQFVADYGVKHGEQYAKVLCEQPGTSEHQTGLAVDIVLQKDQKWLTDDQDVMKYFDIIECIHKKLPNHGFILSHDYLLWHIRYVGDPIIAQDITKKNITLAQYVKQTT